MNWAPATPEEREILTRLRADEWQDRMGVDRYIGRTRRLHAHPFGQKHLRTYRVLEEGIPVSGVDVLEIPFSVRQKGKMASVRGALFASAVTRPDARGKGYFSFLLREVMKHEAFPVWMAFSEIDPAFYKPFGYEKFPTWIHTGKAEAGHSEGVPLSQADFLNLLRAERESITEESILPLPDEEYLDWHLERYRYFAEQAGTRLEVPLFWNLRHGNSDHWMLAAPDFIARRLDGLWVHDCPECRSFLAHHTARLGLRTSDTGRNPQGKSLKT